MRIYFLIVLLSLIRSYSIYAEQNHPLAKLWGIEDIEVPKLLESERNLIAIDKILRPILEQDNFSSSFGGSTIYPKENIITVHTVNFSKVDDLLALPQINPYKDFLSFDKAENSMSLSQLEYNFDQIAFEVSSINPERTFIYTDLELNNNVLYFFNSGINNSATEPYNPKIIYENSSPASQNITQLRLTGITNNVFFYAPWRSDSSSGLLIGPMVYHMTNPHDFGIIDFVGKDVVPTFSVRNDVAAAYIELTITDSAPVSSVGAHVCKSGRTTYFTCGYVLGLNGRSYGNVDGIKKDLIISDMTSRRGDSGGTVLSFVSPQNLNSVVVQGIIYGGGILLHAAQSIDIIFKEIRENTIYDLTLYTGGSSSS
ncbi:hypothetical protein F8M41_009065 [Gigaspora margarita]|uniref:Uncharacterized protein n=1 Tax=Gigaspora margarita TaxID=4874 RepID=A0A8H4AVC7_GIGMA|nr:hypothetical protein F8M41_009065 [Gigaspora margarita]